MERRRRADMWLYLPHSLLATTAVVLLPCAIVISVVIAWDPQPRAVVATLLGIALATIAAVIGHAVWKTRPESVDISFGELMIWGWYRRKRAEERLARGEHLLGIDRQEDLPRVVRVDANQQLAILRDLTAALESKDPYTHGHSRRVETHVARTAAAMGLSEQDVDDLRKAASLHDVGKIRVPDRILRKEGYLTSEERILLEDHVLVGAWMVSSVGNTDVVLGVRHHHERWDGSGYPNGFMGTEIPLFARIIAVADAYDAMTSSRPYRASLGRDHALETLRAESGRQFDPIVVEAFLTTLPARIPVAAFMPLLALPRRFMREVAASVTRAGAGSVASAVGAAGVAAILGVAAVSPVDEPSAPTQSAENRINGSDVDEAGEREGNGGGRPPRVSFADPNVDGRDRPDGERDGRDGSQVLSERLRNERRDNGGDGRGENGEGPVDPEPQPGKPDDDEPEGDDEPGDDDGNGGGGKGNGGNGGDQGPAAAADTPVVAGTDDETDATDDGGTGDTGSVRAARDGTASVGHGHPHGGPPGQAKKDWSRHPHGGPPGQAKKDWSGGHGHPRGGPPGQSKKGKH